MQNLTPLSIVLNQVESKKVQTPEQVAELIKTLIPVEEEAFKEAYRTGYNDYANFDYFAETPQDFFDRKYKKNG
jgi:hypothetical protein